MRDIRITRSRAPETASNVYLDALSQARSRASSVPLHIFVLSGKGGVGKSFIACSLAYFLSKRNLRVLLYDADEVSSSVPYVMGALGASATIIQKTKEGSITIMPPDRGNNLHFLSVEEFLPETGVPLLWEGALRSRFIIETISALPTDLYDVVVYDLPAGTGDEILTLSQVIERKAAVIVTIPGPFSERVARKAIVFCYRLRIPIVAIIENMSYYVCPTGKTISVFGESVADKLAIDYDIKFVFKLPFYAKVQESMDKGTLIQLLGEESEISKRLSELTDNLIVLLGLSNKT